MAIARIPMKHVSLIGFLIPIMSFCIPGVLMADSPAPNREHIIYSANGEYAARLTPFGGWGGRGDGVTRVYKVENGELGEHQYKIEVFANSAYLSNEKDTLVVFGPWASDVSDLALAFYHNAKLVTSYDVSEIVSDESLLARSVTHFLWRQHGKEGFSEDQNEFFLTLGDGTVVRFDSETGKKIE
jgi:hypothetical protein